MQRFLRELAAESGNHKVSKPQHSCNHDSSHKEGTVVADIVSSVLQGEPFIVNIGWAMLAASFSFSLAAVVWGRSGM